MATRSSPGHDATSARTARPSWANRAGCGIGGAKMLV
jgi:hypothetical protein